MNQFRLLKELEQLSCIALEQYRKVCSDFMDYELDEIKFQVVSNNRLRTKAGRCLFVEKTKDIFIEFNLKLLSDKSYSDKYETVSHEISHAIEFFVFGMSDHSNRWRGIHKSIGGSGLSGHNFLD